LSIVLGRETIKRSSGFRAGGALSEDRLRL
jgi:hypothetical protein